MNVVPDTSVWVDFLREGPSGPAGDLDRLLVERSVLACGPVVAELLSGLTAERQSELWLRLIGLPWANLDREAWRLVGTVAWKLRQSGDVVPLTDVMIAVAAHRAGAALWSHDRDFARIRAALPDLDLYRRLS